MTFCIYDEVFDGNLLEEDIDNIMVSLFDNLKFILNNFDEDTKFIRNNSFKDKFLTEDKTIYLYIQNQICNVKFEKEITILSTLLQQSPSVENILDLCCEEKIFPYYSLISPNMDSCKQEVISYNGKEIRNFYSCEQMEKFRWKYEGSPKHGEFERYDSVRHEVVSEMDLGATEAQMVLSQGIRVKNIIYGYCSTNNKWYGFRRTNIEENTWHGYAEKNIPPCVSKSFKEIQELKYKKVWQFCLNE